MILCLGQSGARLLCFILCADRHPQLHPPSALTACNILATGIELLCKQPFCFVAHCLLMHTRCFKNFSLVVKRQKCHIRAQQITDLICSDKNKLNAEVDAVYYLSNRLML